MVSNVMDTSSCIIMLLAKEPSRWAARSNLIQNMTQGGPINSTNILATSMVTKVFTEYDYGQGSAIGVIIMVILFTYSIIYLKVMKKSEDDV